MFHPQSESREMDASAQTVIYFRYSLGPLSMIGAPHSDWVVLPQLSLSKKKNSSQIGPEGCLSDES